MTPADRPPTASPADDPGPQGSAAPPSSPARDRTSGSTPPPPPPPPPAHRPWKVEGLPETHHEPEPPHWLTIVRRMWWVVLLLLAVNWVVASWLVAPVDRTEVSYSFFRTQLDADNVAAVTTSESSIEGTFEKPVDYAEGDDDEPVADVEEFSTQRPDFATDEVIEELVAGKAEVRAKEPEDPAWWVQLLVGFGPTLLFIGLLVWFFRRSAAAAGGGGMLTGLGKSRARRYSPSSGPGTTFADVAGIDEVRDEVAEIVDFLRDPERYRRLGAQIPLGVLLTGAPGTGKTLLAKAVAGEAQVPFFSISASEFIEMIVGVGASRVRDLFDQAKKAAPSIVFIDELDAIGRTRGSTATFSGHDEREQTLNQILTEMDGFTGNEGVVVLAATNRPEILDPALLRAGRFDRHIVVNAPDQPGRRQILAVHTRGVPLDPAVSLETLASGTPGMVGADLKNLVNEAALLAARRNHTRVGVDDFSDAVERIILGTARRLLLAPEEKERTAYHESGHALLGMLTPGADPVRKVSIIPRGDTLGATLQTPEADRHGYTASYLRGRITDALGGRAAEELVYGDVTTGAESDLELVTAIARHMVGRWGMSEAIGPVSVVPGEGREQPFDVTGPSTRTRELVDTEVRRIIEECYDRALDTLRDHRPQLDRLATALLAAETLDEDQAADAAGVPRRRPTTISALGAAETTEPAGPATTGPSAPAPEPKAPGAGEADGADVVPVSPPG